MTGCLLPAAEALLTRMSGFLDVDLDLTDLHSQAQDMIARLNEAVADRPDARKLIRSLEAGTPDFAFDDGSNIADEVDRSSGESATTKTLQLTFLATLRELARFEQFSAGSAAGS